MSGFTKKQVYEVLSKYPQETTSMVLAKLGFDENTQEYPVDAIENIESLYESMGIAAQEQRKAIAASGEPEDTQLVVQQRTDLTVELLEEQGISFPVEVVMALAQSAVNEGVQLAKNLQSLKKAGMMAQLKSDNAELAQTLLNVMSNSNGIVQEVFSVENSQAFVEASVPQVAAPNVAGFLAVLDNQKRERQQLRQAEQQQRAALPPRKVDVKAFLAARQ